MEPGQFIKYALIALAVFVVLISLTYVDFGDVDLDPTQPIPAQTATTVTLAPSGTPTIGGTFTLTDDQGNVVTEASLRGKYHLIFFGFANCAEACPAMLTTMDWVFRELPEETRNRLQMVFVSVDPMRDTAATLGEYVRGFNPTFVGWLGNEQQIDQMTKNYLAYYAVPEGADPADPAYQVDHSTYLYLMGPAGQYITHFRQSDSAAQMRDKLLELVK